MKQDAALSVSWRAGRARTCEMELRRGGREQIEPEVVPAEPAETGRPEAEQTRACAGRAGGAE